MARRFVRALALLAVAALGCQTYNFSPVNHCIIQPGTERFTLSSVSTADILFVVDDSGSMAGEQANLARNFGTFVNEITTFNADRVARQLDPLDFHIAITTTSVFYNPKIAECRTDCQGFTGASMCCDPGTRVPELQPQRCPSGGGCDSGTSCRNDCAGFSGEPVCCSGAGATPHQVNVPCTIDPGLQAAGQPTNCGDLQTRYSIPVASTCIPGEATTGAKFPQGDFVAKAGNPKVLHFDAALYQPTVNQAAIDALVQQFKDNVSVGTCGSPQEQALQAARLAIQKAVGGRQPGVAASEWPHANSKLVVVLVGDEDDCASPADPAAGVVFVVGAPVESCAADGTVAGSVTHRYPVQDFADYVAGLGRPLAGGVIASANCYEDPVTLQSVCSAAICCDTVCTGNANVCTTATCGGQGAGTRALEFASGLEAKGADVVTGSICDTEFGTILKKLANIVIPPETLTLPSVPASSEVALLRIADLQGVTRKICVGPAPGGTAIGTATTDFDWWFTATQDPGAPTAPTTHVFINHTRGTCEANPGETYSVDYLGLLPPPSPTNPTGGCAVYTDCGDTAAAAAGFQCCTHDATTGAWTCDSAGARATLPVRGTCLCAGTL